MPRMYHNIILCINIFSADFLIGPNDVAGGKCPPSTYIYNAAGICSEGCCCCAPYCCWDKCDTKPVDCIKEVENIEWRFVAALGYNRAFQKKGIHTYIFF